MSVRQSVAKWTLPTIHNDEKFPSDQVKISGTDILLDRLAECERAKNGSEGTSIVPAGRQTKFLEQSVSNE